MLLKMQKKEKQKKEEERMEDEISDLRCELIRLSELLKFKNFKDFFPKFLEKKGGIITSIEERDEVYPLLIRFKLFGMDLLFDVGRQQFNQEFAQLSFSLWRKEIPNNQEIINVEKIPKDKQILIYKTLNEIINSCIKEQENLEGGKNRYKT